MTVPQRGVHLIDHITGHSPAGIVCPAVTPRRTEWLPDLLTKLQALTEEVVRTHATTDHPWRASTRILNQTLPAWNDLTQPWSDDVAEAVAYTRAITALALRDDAPDGLSNTVTTVGTGRGQHNASLGALAKGPVALHRELNGQPRVLTLLLDGPSWTELKDRRTGVRALATIAVLAAGFHVRIVASPALRRHLSNRYPDWSDAHLTGPSRRDGSHQTTHPDTDSAWDALSTLNEPRKRRLLASLNPDIARTYHDIATDDDIDIAAGTVSRYVLDLESRGLVTVDRHKPHNAVRLTDTGNTAVSTHLDADCNRIHPDQRRLDGGLTATPQAATSTVSPGRADPRVDPAELEAWIATTNDDEYVQWLTGPDHVSETAIHQRFTLAAEEGITLVDDQPHRFDDGRVAYLSHGDDELLCMLQWGGPLPTLGRLAGALLSEKALTTVLTPDRAGDAFETLHTGAFTQRLPRILRRGHQVGWYGTDESTYEAWRDRITTVRDELLSRLADCARSSDTAARTKLFNDLHGVIATATQLYHAAGIDLTTTIRLPDTDAIARNTRRRRDLCDFLAHTVPKQSVYGIHAGYRLLFEDRPEKLRRRLPYETEPNTSLDLTMSWVLAGPTATALKPDITDTLTAELATVREAIATGTELAPTLEIPVRDATTYPAIARLIRRLGVRSTTTEHDHSTQWHHPSGGHRHVKALVRYCLRAIGPGATPRRACPYDVVTVFLQAQADCEAALPLQPAALERAAATLPATRFRPDLTPTATKLYAALCHADGPLGRSTLIERAGISASSYDRRLSDLTALERVRAVRVDGHRRWVLTDPPDPQDPPTPTSDSDGPSHGTETIETTEAIEAEAINKTETTVTTTLKKNPTHHTISTVTTQASPDQTAPPPAVILIRNRHGSNG